EDEGSSASGCCVWRLMRMRRPIMQSPMLLVCSSAESRRLKVLGPADFEITRRLTGEVRRPSSLFRQLRFTSARINKPKKTNGVLRALSIIYLYALTFV